MNYRLEELIDIKKVQPLLENFSRITGIVTALLDLDGNILISAGWRDICTKFHRVCPETAKRCTESDTILAGAMAEGKKYAVYECLNGLIDIAVPILVEGKHLGNIFSGQFLFAAPDRERFREQAAEFGFDEVTYLEALDRVPIFSEGEVKAAADFLLNLTRILAEMGLDRIEQLETQKALEESENRYRAIAEDMPVMICRFLPGGEIVYINKVYCEYFGKSVDELIGSNFSLLIPEADRETVMANLSALTPESPTQLNEHKVIVAGGEIRWQRWNNRAIFNSEGKIVSYQSVGEDVTDQRSAEEELKDEKEFTETALNTLEDIFYVFNLEGGFIRWNERLKEVSGYDEQEIASMMPIDFFLREDRERLSAAIEEAIKTGFSRVDARLQTKVGETIPFEMTGTLLKDSEGQPVGLCGTGRDISERKRAEEEVSSAQSFLDTIVDMSPFAMWVSDREGTIIRTNRSLRETLNLTDDQLIGGYNVLKDLNLEKQNLMPVVRTVFEKGEPARFTMRWMASDVGDVDLSSGRDMDIDVSMFPIVDAGGNITNVVCQWVNISEQTQAERQLRQSEARFRNLFDNAAFGIIICRLIRDDSGRAIDFEHLNANAAIQKQTGFEIQQIIGKRASELISPEDNSRLTEIYSQVVETGNSYEYEEYFAIYDRTLKVGAFHIKGDLFALTVVDISMRKKAEEEVTRLAKFPSENPNPVLRVDVDGKIIFANPGSRPLLDYWKSAENKLMPVKWRERCRGVLGSNQVENFEEKTAESIFLLTLIPVSEMGYVNIYGLDITVLKEAEDEVIRLAKFPSENPNPVFRINQLGRIIYSNQGGRSLLEYWKTAENEPLPAQWCDRCARVLDSNQVESFEEKIKDSFFLLTLIPVSEMGYVNVYGLDITAIKETEEELRKYREHLEELVQARTAELEAFSHSVSHDLRAPLRSMDGFSQAVLKDYAEKLDERGRDYLRRVRSASQKMGNLIDDLLKLARVSRAEMGRGRVDLSVLARSIAGDCQAAEPERKVEFMIEEGLTTEGDRRLLRLMLENLVGNAWKFTSKGKKALIEFGRIDRDGKQVYFVRDNGAGFEMKYVDKLFGPFQRLHTEKEFPGTGIGLATVRRIVSRHGGEVWAEGAVAKGATIYFTLS